MMNTMDLNRPESETDKLELFKERYKEAVERQKSNQQQYMHGISDIKYNIERAIRHLNALTEKHGVVIPNELKPSIEVMKTLVNLDGDSEITEKHMSALKSVLSYINSQKEILEKMIRQVLKLDNQDVKETYSNVIPIQTEVAVDNTENTEGDFDINDIEIDMSGLTALGQSRE